MDVWFPALFCILPGVFFPAFLVTVCRVYFSVSVGGLFPYYSCGAAHLLGQRILLLPLPSCMCVCRSSGIGFLQFFPRSFSFAPAPPFAFVVVDGRSKRHLLPPPSSAAPPSSVALGILVSHVHPTACVSFIGLHRYSRQFSRMLFFSGRAML